jgi:ankyrin repeat protein
MHKFVFWGSMKLESNSDILVKMYNLIERIEYRLDRYFDQNEFDECEDKCAYISKFKNVFINIKDNIIYKNDEFVKILVDNNYEIINDERGRLIHFICKYGSEKSIKYIIDSGYDLNCVDIYKNRPIHLILTYSTEEMVEYIINAGARIECDNSICSPIRLACMYGKKKTIKLLLSLNCAMEDGLLEHAINNLH